jgi:hypothetical protein
MSTIHPATNLGLLSTNMNISTLVDPFQHLASADDPDLDLLPAQPPSLRTRLSRSISRFLDTDESPRTIILSLAVNAVLGVVASHGQLERCASNVADLSPSFIYTLLSSLGASIAGFGALHCPARQSPPGLERPRAGQRHGARRSRRWVLWCAVYITDQACAPLSPNPAFHHPFPTPGRSFQSWSAISHSMACRCDCCGARLVRTSHPPGPGSVPSAPRSKPLPEHLPRPDIVLAADCVYFEPAFPLLVATLAALVPPPHESASPEVLFCYKKRRKRTSAFLHYSRNSLPGLWYATSPLSGLGYFFRD